MGNVAVTIENVAAIHPIQWGRAGGRIGVAIPIRRQEICENLVFASLLRFR